MNDTRYWAWRVVVVLLLVVTACSGGEPDADPERPDPPGTETTTSDVERVPLDEYLIRYDISELDVERTETIAVRRPYLSRRTSRRGSVILDDRITNTSGLWAARNGGWQQLGVGRRLAVADERVKGSLELLAATGLAERLPDGEVLGRRCDRFRTREPMGLPATDPPTDDDHVEYCVDVTDVVLEEVWTLDETIIRHRVATAFELNPDLSKDRFDASPMIDPPAGVHRTVEIDFTEEINQDLITHVQSSDDLHADGAIATVQLDQFGQPVDGTVIRFFTSDWSAATVEELETERLGDGGTSIETPLGGATRTVTLNLVTVSVAVGEGVSLIVRSPDPDLIDRILANTVVDRWEP